jgi:hypothetical protein
VCVGKLPAAKQRLNSNFPAAITVSLKKQHPFLALAIPHSEHAPAARKHAVMRPAV